MKRYPSDVVERAKALYRPGEFGIKQVARVMGIPQTTVTRWLSPTYARTNARASRDAKLRRRGTCRACGHRHTSYDSTSGICTHCETVSRMVPRWAIDHVLRLYERGESPYAMAERIMGAEGNVRDGVSPILGNWIREHGQMRSKGEGVRLAWKQGRHRAIK